MRGQAGIERMKKFVPDLRGVHLLPHVGHFVQMEAADDVNRLMIDFLASL